MNPHSVKILRGWLIGVIICVFAAVILNYLLTRTPQRPGSSGILPPGVTETDGIEYFENKNGITRFKIHALHLIETHDGKSYLEGIKAYDFNPDHSIHNEIHSQKAVFDNKRKLIDFTGNVQLFLGKNVEIKTESLQYDLNANVGSSSGSMELHSQSTNGKARGMRFNKEQESLELGSDVDFVFDRKPTQSGEPRETENMRATSGRAYFEGKQNHFVFQGKARIEAKNSGSLSGDKIEVVLSSDQKHVVSLNASGSAAYRTDAGGETRILSGDRMLFSIGKSGVLEKIHVTGQSAFVLNSAAEEETLNGGQIDLEFDAAKRTISQIRGANNVRFRMKRGIEQTLMSGEQLNAQFLPETGKLASIRVVNDAKFSTEGAKDSASNELQSNDIRISFKQKSERVAIEKIRADGSVHWLSTPPQNGAAKNREPARKLDASLLEILYAGEGDYLESGLASGKVVISASAGGPSGQLETRRIFADSARFQFFQKNGQLKNMNAEGHVQTAYESKKPDPKGGSITEQFQTTSDKLAVTFSMMDGRSAIESAAQSGNFTYRDGARSATAGECDYSAGRGVLVLQNSPRISDTMSTTTGERIDYDQNQKLLLVHGRVQSKLSPQKGSGSFLGASSSGSSSPSIIMADELQYRTEAGHFRYSGNVRSITESQQLNARVLEIFNNGERVEAQGDVRNLVKRTGPSDISKETKNASQSPVKSMAMPCSSQSPLAIRSEHLKYLKATGELNYSGNVSVSCADVNVSSSSFDANLDQDGTIKHAIAKGKVHIIQKGGPESKSDVANWSLDAGKYEIEGTPAEVFDPIRGRSRAPRLTYFEASDRILLGK
jgi:LPS export ABC transporter protein LptC